MIRTLLVAFAFLFAAPALAQTYPPLTGRVVDAADLLQPAQEAELTQKLAALEAATHRQLVIATIPSLEGHDIAEYGVGLGRAWRIGQQGANNGIVFIVAPAERKIRIEVGYGMEGVMTDALSSQIIRNVIEPRFKAGDIPGGIAAGTDAIVAQLQAPPEAAEANLRNAAVQQQQAQSGGRHRNRGSSIGPLIIWGGIFLFILLPAFGAGLAGRRYRGGRHGVSIWGPGQGGGGSGLGWVLLGAALSNMNRGGGSSWGGGGGGSWGGGGGGGGGFSGGGGSFGGGGASGGW